MKISDAEIVELRLLASHAKDSWPAQTNLEMESTLTGMALYDVSVPPTEFAQIYGSGSYWRAGYVIAITPEKVLRMIETITDLDRERTRLSEENSAYEAQAAHLNADNAKLCDEIYAVREQVQDYYDKCMDLTMRLAEACKTPVIPFSREKVDPRR